MVVMNGTAAQAARESLRELALGDGFGDQWFPRRNPAAAEMIRNRQNPTAAQWRWSDDTAMALSVLQVLEHEDDGRIDQRRLGNGAAMRVAPLGAWFRDDLDQAAQQAARSAEVTHAHPDGVAGAVAVVVAAALAAGSRGEPPAEPARFLRAVAERTPEGAVRDGVTAAAALDPDLSATEAAGILGSGKKLRADDTVPFALWSAARNLGDLAGGLWCTAEGFGDVDTTCAITGGVVAARTGPAGVPDLWWERCEPLPPWTFRARDAGPTDVSDH